MNLKRAAKWVRYTTIGVTGMVLRAVDQDLGRRYVVREMSRIPGLPAKVGQLLSMRFGKMEWQEFAPEPVPLSWVKSRIEQEVPLLAREIESIEAEGVLASLGQVHRALLRDGREVAIKVRYPQVDEQVEQQVDLMMIGLRKVPFVAKSGMDFSSYEEFFKKFFARELDYLQEAQVQEAFRLDWANDPAMVIPKVWKEFSTRSVLTQSFEASIGLEHAYDWTLGTRDSCAQSLSRFMVRGIFEHRKIHVDLHPKNWGFRPEERQLVIYDFGSTLELRREWVETLQSLLTQPEIDEQKCLEAFVNLGFIRERLVGIRDKLPGLVELLLEPLISNQAWSVESWNLQERMESLLGADKWAFRMAGPPWFLMFIRSLNGWLFALRELRQPVILWKDLPFRVRAQPSGSKPFISPSPVVQAVQETSSTGAKSLFVRVLERGVEVIHLEFPARAVENLTDLMPDAAMELLRAKRIDLEEIKNRAIATGLAPQTLLEIDLEGRSYRIWLE